MKLSKTLMSLVFTLSLGSHSFAENLDKFSSFYTVPGTEDLTPFSTFAIKKASFSIENEQVSINFAFPPALVGGKSILISLTGQNTDGFADVVDSDLGVNGTCSIEATNVNCNLDYRELYDHLGLNENIIKNFMLNEFKNDPNLEQFLKIGEIFSEDPIGVLSIQRVEADDTILDQ